MSLLTLLEKDFSNKTTVSDCLRSGRTLPVAEVQRILADNTHQSFLDKSVLHSTNALVLSSLTKLKLVKASGAPTSSSASAAATERPSSNQAFTTVAQACHWIQFLCECHGLGHRRTKSVATNKQNKTAGEENQSPQQQPQEANESSTATIDTTVAIKMIKQVLSSLSGVLHSLLNNPALSSADRLPDDDTTDLMDTDTTQHFDGAQVAAFAFAYILRLNHYVHEIPSLLTLIWKSLDEITKSFAPSSSSLPPSLWTLAFKSLTSYLADGVQAVVQQIHPFRNQTPQIAHAPGQWKLIKYFLGRLSVYCQLSSNKNVALSLFQPQRLSKLVMPLSLLMGMGALHNEQAKKKQPEKEDEEYAKVFQKAEGLTSILFHQAESSDAKEDTTFSETLRLAVTPVSNDTLWPSDPTDPKNPRLHHAILSIGNLSIQLRLLDAVAEKNVAQTTLEEHLLTHRLKLCESILFTTLPGIMCCDVTQEIISLQVSKVLSAIVRAFVDTGCSALTSSTDSTAFSENFHFLLVSWLGRAQRETCHPLAREVFLTALCEYSESFSENPPFLAFILHLVFDARTKDNLRDGLMELIRRLAASKSTKDVVRRWITARLETITKATTGRKRKRSRDEKRSTTTALACIVPILDLVEVTLSSVSASTKTQNTVAYGEMAGDKLVSHIQTISGFASVNSHHSGRKTAGLLQSIQYLASFENKELELKDLQSIVDLVQTYSRRDSMDPSLRSIAIGILGVIGDSLQTHATKFDVERILQLLTSLLRSESWPLRSQALAVFVNLATKIPQTHKSALRECLPNSLLKAFQSRVKKTSLYARLDIQELETRHVMSLPNPLQVDQTSLFPARESIQLVEGSYIMKMPTVDGRSAVVVFPPNPSSLSDIRYMLSSDDTGEEPVVHKIRRIVTQGGGCKLSLSRHE